MQPSVRFVCMLLVATQLQSIEASSEASSVNPIQKVLQLLGNLQKKILAEGTAAQKAYEKYSEFCEDRSAKLGNEIKTGKKEVAQLKATIDSQAATITLEGAKIEQLSSDISGNEASLKASTATRESDAAAFVAKQKEMTTMIDQLNRATSILTKEMKKHGASMLQTDSAHGITDALALLVEGLSLDTEEASQLTAFVQQGVHQTQQDSEEDELSEEYLELAAPKAASYEGHGNSIISTLENLLEKSEGQLDKLRKAETKSLQDFTLLKQSLTDSIKFANADMTESKLALAEAQEKKSVAEGGLQATSKDLAGDVKARAALHRDCMTAATTFEVSTANRGKELAAIAEAVKVLTDTTKGATAQKYGKSALLQQPSEDAPAMDAPVTADQDGDVDLSFVQVKTQSSSFKAVHIVRELARKQGSPALLELASRMASVMRLGTMDGADPFKKVRGMIVGMVKKLEAAALAETTHKAYCDKEQSETGAKMDDKKTQVEKLSTKIDQRKSASKKLKNEVATLQVELSTMAKSMAKATALRQSQNAAYKKNKPEMEQGLNGVKMALKVLRDYYAQDASVTSGEGAGSTIIGLLEVVESDFTKSVAEMVAEEEQALSKFKDFMQASKEEKIGKEADVKYKTKEFKGLDKAVSELSGDLAGVKDQLAALVQYNNKLKESCTAKVEPYAERKKRREANIAGLKDALSSLEGNAASLYQQSSTRTLRGARAL